MGKINEIPGTEWSDNKSSLLNRIKKFWWEKVKKFWWEIKDRIHELFHSEDYMLCSENEECPYFWLEYWDTFKLVNRKTWEEILEADEVKPIETIEWINPTSIGRIFHSTSGWWLITNNWTIVQGKYEKMGLYSISVKNHEYTVAIWEDQYGKKWYISINDWLVSEDLETQIDKCIAENPYHNIDRRNNRKEKVKKFRESTEEKLRKFGNDIKENFEKFSSIYQDEQYNRVFRKRFSLKGWTKEGVSYMKNWKVWIYWILKAEYENVAPCSDDYIRVMLWKKRWLVDTEGKMLIEPKFENVYKNTYEINNKRWIINNKWEALEAKYDKIHKDGRVEIAGKYWLINIETGEEIIKPKYDKIYDDGRVRVGSKMWLVDRKNGREIIEPKYDIIFKDGRTLLGMKEWLVDIKRGIEILEPKYDDVLLFKWYSIVIPVLKNNYGLVSKIDWSVIKNIEFDAIRKDSKNGTLTLSFIKKGTPDDVFDCSAYKEVA